MVDELSISEPGGACSKCVSSSTFLLSDVSMAWDEASYYTEGHDPVSFWSAFRDKINEEIGRDAEHEPRAFDGR